MAVSQAVKPRSPTYNEIVFGVGGGQSSKQNALSNDMVASLAAVVP